MPDAGTQLREYFDEVVERVTEEDVRIRAATGHAVSLPARRLRLSPAAAGAVGFGLAMTLLGAALLLDRFLGPRASDVGGGGGGTSATATGVEPSLWLLGLIIAGIALIATVVVVTRPRNSSRSQGDGTMQTIDEQHAVEAPVGDETSRLKKRSRWLSWLSGVLAVAVIALGAFVIFDGGSADAELTPIQEQMQETIDDYLAAWNAGDGEAAVALMRPSAYHDNGSTKIYVTDGQLANYVERVHSQGFSVRSTDASFVGSFVFTTDFIPATSESERPSLFKMTPDGTQIIWHMAP